MQAPHLECLINHINGSGSLDSHNDIPSNIRRDLALESQIGRKSKKTDTLTTRPPYPPTIINILPVQNGTNSAVTSSVHRLPSNDHIVIPRSREAAVREYYKWLESHATDEAYKADFRKIYQVTLENHLDLKLILKDPDSGFFIQQGIQIGTARRFLRDIKEWAAIMSSNELN